MRRIRSDPYAYAFQRSAPLIVPWSNFYYFIRHPTISQMNSPIKIFTQHDAKVLHIP